jgi:hypothetical protein
VNSTKSFCLSLLLVAFSAEGADIEDLEARHQISISTPQGKSYEMKAVQAFWGDAGFMRTCAPSDIPTPNPITIYFEVKPDGSLGQVVIHPRTRAGSCIATNVEDRRFPTPPNDYVGRIDLKFEN